jgi:chorismate synthase
MMSINAIKGVEIGMGFAAAATPGSQVHDEFAPDPEAERGVQRLTNRAAGRKGASPTASRSSCGRR